MSDTRARLAELLAGVADAHKPTHIVTDEQERRFGWRCSCGDSHYDACYMAARSFAAHEEAMRLEALAEHVVLKEDCDLYEKRSWGSAKAVERWLRFDLPTDV